MTNRRKVERNECLNEEELIYSKYILKLSKRALIIEIIIILVSLLVKTIL